MIKKEWIYKGGIILLFKSFFLNINEISPRDPLYFHGHQKALKRSLELYRIVYMEYEKLERLWTHLDSIPVKSRKGEQSVTSSFFST